MRSYNNVFEVDTGNINRIRVGSAALNCVVTNQLSLGTSAILWSEVWATDGSINISDARTKTSTDLELGLAFVKGAPQNIVRADRQNTTTRRIRSTKREDGPHRPWGRRFRRVHRPDSRRTHTGIARGHGPATGRLGQPGAPTDRIYRTRLRRHLVNWPPASKRSKPHSPKAKTNERRQEQQLPYDPDTAIRDALDRLC